MFCLACIRSAREAEFFSLVTGECRCHTGQMTPYRNFPGIQAAVPAHLCAVAR
jgi:hypothetical protein